MLIRILFFVVAALFGQVAAADPTPDEIRAFSEALKKLRNPSDEAITALKDLNAVLTSGNYQGEQSILDQAKDIVTLSDANSELTAEIMALVSVIETYKTSVFEDKVSGLAADLKKKLESVSNSSFPSELQTELSVLGDELMKHYQFDLSKAADILGAAIEKAHANGQLTEARVAEVVTAALTLHTYNRLGAVGAFSDAFVDVLNEFDTSKLPALTATELGKLDSLMTRINTTLGKDFKRGIHVISSQYGRISTAFNGSRCDVTSAVRTECHQKPHCMFSDDARKAFCGGSTELGDANNTGIIITYQCLSGPEETWAAALASPNGATGVPHLNTILWNDDDTLLCGNRKAE